MSAIETLRPSDTPEYMTQAWVDCIRYAASDDNILAAFQADTGNKWTPGRTPIERMVDEAAGAGRDLCEQFIRWVNVNIWGPVDMAVNEMDQT